MQTDEEEQALLLDLRRRAMDMLARREHARAELERKLLQRFADADSSLIGEALDQLERDNLLSETRFVESCLRSRMQRGYGPRYIEQYLQQRGVAGHLIAMALEGVDEEDWCRLAEEVLEKKLGSEPRPEPGSRHWQRLQRYLGSRGFTGSQIGGAFRDG